MKAGRCRTMFSWVARPGWSTWATRPCSEVLGMSDPIERWRRLHVRDLADLHERWRHRPDESDDRLMDPERWDEARRVWTVRSELELVRLLGALRWWNAKHTLWFRGETKYWEKSPPARYRGDDTTAGAVRWLSENARRSRALRDRSPFARLAILQHYGCPTLLLDVTLNFEVAC